jgi:hypothetical protein
MGDNMKPFFLPQADPANNIFRLRSGAVKTALFLALFLSWAANGQAATLSVSSVTVASTCVGPGGSVNVTAIFAGVAKNTSYFYVIGFGKTASDSSNDFWATTGAVTIKTAFNFSVTSGNTTNPVTVTQTVTAPLTGTYNDVIVDVGTSNPVPVGSKSGSVAVNFPCVPTPTPGPYCPTPTGATSSTLQGGCDCFNNQANLLSDSSVFGMSLSNLQAVADYSGSSSSPLSIVSDWKISYYSGSVTYDTSFAPPYNALNAKGLLVVNGDLIMDAGCCSFDGVIFCTGNVTIADGDVVLGSVILGKPYANGTPGILSLTGSGANYGQIIYNPVFVTEVQQKAAIFKEDLSQRKSFQTVPNW